MKLNAKKIERKSKKLKVFCFDKVDSTNNIAKNMALNDAKEGTLVIANEQSAGRGRLGRTFLSKRGGIYFSIVLRPQSNACNTLFITVAAAVAAARAIESVSGKGCDIKWVNDIYINNKKVCGILSEGGFDANAKLDYCILGVGVNLFAPKEKFPQNLPLADSVFDKKSKILFKKLKKEQLVIEFHNNFFEFYNKLEQKEFIKEYQSRSLLTGKQITYTQNGKNHNGTVIGIDDDARLIVDMGGKTQVLSHGEIQIVGMEQLLL